MRRLSTVVLVGLTLMATPLRAQRDVGRALAFVGCWEDAEAGAAGMTCVLPQEGPALMLITVPPTGARTESVLRLDGTRVEITTEGCTGWERARISRDDERIVMDSEIACSGLPRQQRAGAFLITEQGNWLQLQGGGVASIATTQARQLRPVVGLQVIPTDLRPLIAPFLAEAEATRAAIAGRRVSAQDLIELDDLGTAGPIIDLIVAASYPESFAIVGGGRDFQSRRSEVGVATGGGGGGSGIPRYSMLPPTTADWALWNSCMMMWGIRDPWACGGRAPFAYYGLFSPVYGGFGYGYWGSPFGGFWPGYAGGPVVVQPIGPGGVPIGRTPESGGRVVTGGGSSAPSGGGSSGARPRSGDSGGSSVRSGSSGGGSTSSGSSGASSGGSSSGSSSSGGGRTAKPRDP
ncbi:MAG: hypothetical protein ACK5ED_01430 [Gemmatimonadota bacterium]